MSNDQSITVCSSVFLSSLISQCNIQQFPCIFTLLYIPRYTQQKRWTVEKNPRKSNKTILESDKSECVWQWRYSRKIEIVSHVLTSEAGDGFSTLLAPLSLPHLLISQSPSNSLVTLVKKPLEEHSRCRLLFDRQKGREENGGQHLLF